MTLKTRKASSLQRRGRSALDGFHPASAKERQAASAVRFCSGDNPIDPASVAAGLVRTPHEGEEMHLD
jgi:hypothetical protein